MRNARDAAGRFNIVTPRRLAAVGVIKILPLPQHETRLLTLVKENVAGSAKLKAGFAAAVCVGRRPARKTSPWIDSE